MGVRASVAGALLVLLSAACAKKDAPSQATAEPSATSSAAPAQTMQVVKQILKDGSAPSDPMLGNVGPIPMPPPSVTEPIVTANNAFAFDLYKRLAKLPDNVVFSPASISIALAMTWPGAKGDTAAEMKKTMHFAAEPAATADGWGKIARAVGSRGLTLRMANRLFGEKTYVFEQPFLDMAQSSFGAPIELSDFKTSPEAVRTRINDWVADQTQKRIKDILPPRSLGPETRLVLANAVYFFADWATPFEKSETKNMPFYIGGTKPKDLPMMHGGRKLRAAKTDGVTIVELPYKGYEASMFLVVPDKRDGIVPLDGAITAAKYEAWMKGLSNYAVDLTMPRFEITTPSLALNEHLQALGMPLAFDAKKADFTGIGKPQGADAGFFLGSVRHKAFVRVDEEGTEAAAATVVTGVATTSVEKPPPPLEVVVDHPFLFFIVDRDTRLVLFMGRVNDPG